MARDLSQLSELEFDRALRRRRGLMPLRLLLVGVILVAVGVMLQLSAHEGVVGPYRWLWGGPLFCGLGGLFAVLSLYRWWRMLRDSRSPIPEARVRRDG